MREEIVEWALFILGTCIFLLALLGPFVLYAWGVPANQWGITSWEFYLTGLSFVAYTVIGKGVIESNK